MKYCKIIPTVKVLDEKTLGICEDYCNNGADELLIFESSIDDSTHEKNINILKQISGNIDIPFMVSGNIKRLEDVKKFLYAGASRVVFTIDKDTDISLIKEASERFGKEKIALSGIVDDIDLSLIDLIIKDSTVKKSNEVYGVILDISKDADKEIASLKEDLNKKGINTFILESSKFFGDFKTTSFGTLDLVPVVVQDYRTNEVLMVAYMDKEAFDLTIATGKMIYFSRSRNEIWVKGLTSGHFQYLKELRCDCDSDTLLAKVFQVGAACHTGNYSCFYDTIAKKEYRSNNPNEVLNNVFDIILERKENPKQGSYTNYLFDKGVDKILKKLGEEATEIVIAAKNPEPEEIKYEISDFLYHMMVLMAEKGVTWQEITDELSRRG